MSGAVTMTIKNTKVIRLPTVICPLITSRPPTYIAINPITPTTASPKVPVSDVPVMVLAIFSNSFCTPFPNTSFSRSSAVYTLISRMPPSVSVSRPVTSAVITLRSRKIGRRRLNAIDITTPNTARNTIVAAVRRQLR